MVPYGLLGCYFSQKMARNNNNPFPGNSCALLLLPQGADHICSGSQRAHSEVQEQLTAKPRAVHQMQRTTGLGDGKQLSKGPATTDKPVSGHKHRKVQSSGDMSYSHSPNSCVKGGTLPVLCWLPKCHSAGPSHSSKFIQQPMADSVFPDSDLFLSPLIPQGMTNSSFLLSFPLADAFLTQGRSIRCFPGLVSHGHHALLKGIQPTQLPYKVSFKRNRSNPFLRPYLLNTEFTFLARLFACYRVIAVLVLCLSYGALQASFLPLKLFTLLLLIPVLQRSEV